MVFERYSHDWILFFVCIELLIRIGFFKKIILISIILLTLLYTYKHNFKCNGNNGKTNKSVFIFSFIYLFFSSISDLKNSNRGCSGIFLLSCKFESVLLELNIVWKIEESYQLEFKIAKESPLKTSVHSKLYRYEKVIR